MKGAVVTGVVTATSGVVTPKPVVTAVNGNNRFKEWYEENRDRYLESQRQKMQARRAIASGRACAWPR